MQAEHLRDMLVEQCAESDAALANYGSALQRYEHRGEHAQARRIRGLIRSAERERRSAQQLIAKLEERFLGAAAPVSRVHRPAPAVAHHHPAPSRTFPA